jgi:DNA-binding XRE family transcriptional regulator
MTLLNLGRQIDTQTASLSYKDWTLIKEDEKYLYFIPKGKESACLLRVPRQEADMALVYKFVNPVGEVIRKERISKSYSQRKLSVISGVSQMTISNVENGTCAKINSDTLDSILRTLEIPLDSVYTSQRKLKKL